MMNSTAIVRIAALPLILSLSSGCDTKDPDTDSAGGDSDTSGGEESSDSGPDLNATEREVDIIFVVDNSGSMGEEQAKLARSIGTLVDALDAADPPVDYRIAVTTTDSGNPWCATTTPEKGQFRATSCRSRTDAFVFNGIETVDATDEACLDLCEQDALDLPTPWIEVNGTSGTTNVADGEVTNALGCMIPQGIDGCGFEQPLESLSRALGRSTTPGDANEGFLRPGALLAVAVVTDEGDCSNNPGQETIFMPGDDRLFWSDKDSPAPTSAVCWNAGVECSDAGDGTLECSAVDLDANGEYAASNTDAVLKPLAGYIEQLTSQATYMVTINGVSPDGTAVYADATADPQFQQNFGIGAGCSSASGTAVPPVRLREVVESVSGPDAMHSVCADDFSPALDSMASGILSRLP